MVNQVNPSQSPQCRYHRLIRNERAPVVVQRAYCQETYCILYVPAINSRRELSCPDIVSCWPINESAHYDRFFHTVSSHFTNVPSAKCKLGQVLRSRWMLSNTIQCVHRNVHHPARSSLGGRRRSAHRSVTCCDTVRVLTWIQDHFFHRAACHLFILVAFVVKTEHRKWKLTTNPSPKSPRCFPRSFPSTRRTRARSYSWLTLSLSSLFSVRWFK